MVNYAKDLEERASAAGIVMNAGDHYFADREGPKNYCRLGFSSIPEDRIEEGIAKLAAIIAEM